MIPLNHDFKVFIDNKRYERLIKNNDVLSVVLNLTLIMENFTNVYIKEVSHEEYHDLFLDKKQKQHFKLNVAKTLGLPESIIIAINRLSGIRNSFAHKLDYCLTEKDISEFESVVGKIPLEDITNDGPLNAKEVASYFDSGSKLLGSENYSINPDVIRLVNATYFLALKSAFFTVSELHRRGKLSLG